MPSRDSRAGNNQRFLGHEIETFSIFRYIILNANPDGYYYSHESDRMWRKNRGPTPNSRCFGVDLNRQFPVGHLTTGGSSNPCSNTYASAAPLDQNEAIAWDEWAREVMGYGGGEVAAQISVHSYT